MKRTNRGWKERGRRDEGEPTQRDGSVGVKRSVLRQTLEKYENMKGKRGHQWPQTAKVGGQGGPGVFLFFSCS